jgi:hypothetical protein
MGRLRPMRTQEGGAPASPRVPLRAALSAGSLAPASQGVEETVPTGASAAGAGVRDGSDSGTPTG